MNLVDWVILGIVGISLIFGLYRGFISSVLNVGGCLISFIASFLLYPKATEWVAGDTDLQRTLLNFTDAASRIGDLETSVMSAGSLTPQGIAEVVEKAGLPQPLSQILSSNLTNTVYGSATSVSSYVSQTVLSSITNILTFLIVFTGLYLLISLVLSLIRAIFRFPVLKQLDAAVGGLFGILRGIIIVFALFALVPLVETIAPMDAVHDLIAQSTLAPYFNNGTLLTMIMNGHL